MVQNLEYEYCQFFLYEMNFWDKTVPIPPLYKLLILLTFDNHTCFKWKIMKEIIPEFISAMSNSTPLIKMNSTEYPSKGN